MYLRWKAELNGTSATLGEGIDWVSENDRKVPLTPGDAGSTDQYQPDFGWENLKSPRSGEPVRLPASEIPTEPMRLNR